MEDKKEQAKRNPDKIALEPEEKLILKNLVYGRTVRISESQRLIGSCN